MASKKLPLQEAPIYSTDLLPREILASDTGVIAIAQRLLIYKAQWDPLRALILLDKQMDLSVQSKEAIRAGILACDYLAWLSQNQHRAYKDIRN